MNDSLNDLFAGATAEVRTAPVLQRPAAQEYTKTAVELFTENCKKCRGTGQYGRFGQCFACKGNGKFQFKTSPEARAANRDQKADRKARDGQEAFAAFSAQHPEVAVWIGAKKDSFGFARKMLDTIVRFGDLTANQLAACQRMCDADKARAEARIERIQNAPAVDTAGVDRLKQAFDKARAYAAAKAPGLAIRNPKITIGGITISPAKADSKNAGALYVKDSGVYVGKISGGRFYAANINGQEAAAKIQEFIANPAKAAKVYGQETGVCCICNATLKSKWRLKGIGPVCSEKMGWDGEI